MTELEKMQHQAAVSLIIEQGKAQQYWITRFAMLQIACFTAYGYLEGISSKGDLKCVLIIISILFAVAFLTIIVRHKNWQDAYVEMLKNIQGEEGLLYPKDAVKGNINTKTLYLVFTVILLVGWGYLLLRICCGK